MIRTVRCLLALIRSPFRTRHALGTERPPPHSASSILQPTSARGTQRNSSQRSDRFAVTQPMRPPLGRPEKQLTGWAGRPRTRPHARRSTHHRRSYRLRRLGPSPNPVRTARALLVDRNRTASPTATKSWHDPSLALPATQTRSFADHAKRSVFA